MGPSGSIDPELWIGANRRGGTCLIRFQAFNCDKKWWAAGTIIKGPGARRASFLPPSCVPGKQEGWGLLGML
jgi:hypothetical protein